MIEQTLKPCPNPWCDAIKDEDAVQVSKLGIGWEVSCYRCGMYIHTPPYDSEDDAIAAWNHRPIEDELRGRIKELEAITKEAFPYLINYRNNLTPETGMYINVEKLVTLIKQSVQNDRD